MIYADFDYYTNVYMGNAIADGDFPGFANKASRYIDYITQNRSAKNAELEAVKQCCCALAEQYQLISKAESLAAHSLNVPIEGGGELSSETVGSWSRSYQSGGYSAQTAILASRESRSILLDIARQYLAQTGMLYRGGRCCG